jgi:Dolichyl-phosphate-mannose-protein mannosyltransferase
MQTADETFPADVDTREEAARSRSGLGWQLTIVAAAFLLSQVLVAIGAHRAGVSATSVDSYARWDSGHYLSIAERGYYLEPCPSPPYPVGDWCGNSAWMPGFSWVIRGVSSLGLDLPEAGALVTRVCHIAMLGALWFFFLRDFQRRSAVLALAIAAVFPGFIYYDAVFPVSMAVLAIVASLALLSRGRFLVAGLAGAVATLSYSSGIFLAVAGALAILVLPSLLDWRSRARAAVLYCAPIAAAWSLLTLIWELSTGRWDAYFLTQQQYRHEYVLFLTGLWHRLYDLTRDGVIPRVVPVQTALVSVMVVMCVTAVIIRWRDRDDRVSVLSAFVIVFWAVPLSIDSRVLSSPRYEAFLVPIVALLARFPLWVNVSLFILLVPIGVAMGTLFFDETLV